MTFNFISEDEEEEPKVDIEGLEFSFSSSIPEPARGLTDEARAKAKAVRKKKQKIREESSTFCEEYLHLVCREMGTNCVCPCHVNGEERDWSLKDRPKRTHYPEFVPGSLSPVEEAKAKTKVEGKGDVRWGWQ